MASFELTGPIKLIMEEQTFPSGFSKREFVVTTTDDKYPQDIKFECLKEKSALLDKVSEGQNVKVSFNLSGREYNGKYFVNLTAWRIAPVDSAAPTDTSEPLPEDFGEPLEDDPDNMPF
jgi:hypothetical protein